MSTKPTPQILEDLLRKHDPLRSAHSPNEHHCEGSEFHSPRPLVTRGYRLPNGYTFWLCDTCKANVDILVLLWEKEGDLDWKVQRCFGAHIRAIADMIRYVRRDNV